MGNFKHGHAFKGMHTPEYNSWASMIARCYDISQPRYDRYGGRGIKVCKRWRYSFNNFLDDMGSRPDNCSLERIDNNKHYTPDNCRWATQSEQMINTEIRSDNTSGVKGVFWSKQKCKWCAGINFRGKRKHLGFYTNIEDAKEARKKAEKELKESFIK